MEKKLPLEERFFDVEIDGKRKRISGIDETWLKLKKRNFSRYISHPVEVNGRFILGERELWLELTNYIIDDLEWLLQQKHHIFWSYMIYSKSARQLLTTFLQEAPPFYMRNEFPKDEEMEKALGEIERLVFLVFIRLSTEKESESRYIQNLGPLLYSNYIFTVPILLDICLIYGTRNSHLVGKMLRDVMSVAPSYLNDFSEIFPYLIHVMSIVREKFESNKIPTINTRTITHFNAIRDVILHLYDSTSTVQLFLDLYSNDCNLLISDAFESEIASFYSSVIPKMYKYIKSNDCNMFRNWNFKEKIDNIRLDLLAIVRSIFCGIINEVLNGNERRGESANEYLTKMMEILHEPLFLTDYNRIYPIDGDLKMLTDLCSDVDSENFTYVSNAIAPLNRIEPVKKNQSAAGIQIEAIVARVKDIFPGLNDEFVEHCIKYFDYNEERVISAMLEGNLPPDFEEVGRNLGSIPTQSSSSSTSSQVKLKKIEMMKKKNKEMFDLMNDKTELREMRDRFSQLSLISVDEYDDEYDDTYDSQDISIRGGDDVDERRPFVTPRILRPIDSGGEDSEEDGQERVGAGKERPFDQFVPNPAELRAKQEQRRAERERRDCVGRGRGRGQDKQVLLNRDFKNTHKSFTANHNRRKLASRKRNMPLINS